MDMEHVKKYTLIIALGTLFAYLSVPVFGYSAALAIPEYIVNPLSNISPSFTFLMIDLFTLGLPLALIYVLFTQALKILKLCCHFSSYVLLATPFFALHFYLSAISFPASDVSFYLAATLPKYILLIACIVYMSKENHINQ